MQCLPLVIGLFVGFLRLSAVANNPSTTQQAVGSYARTTRPRAIDLDFGRWKMEKVREERRGEHGLNDEIIASSRISVRCSSPSSIRMLALVYASLLLVGVDAFRQAAPANRVDPQPLSLFQHWLPHSE